ncbi:MAG: Tol-Pal system beta propeller repeat protein TolB [Myxococcota bacterium]
MCRALHLGAIFAAALAVLGAVEAHAAEPKPRVIEVTNPEFRAFPLAVSETKNLDSAPLTEAMKTITDVLRWDLDTSLLFRVLDPRSYLPDPAKESLVASAIDFDAWLNVGAEGLVKAAALESSTQITVDFRYYDVTSRRQLLQKRYEAPPDQARVLAHRFADDIVEFLTGKKGIFRTKLVAVRKLRDSREVWMLDMDGHDLKRLTSNNVINTLPSWFPSGKRVLFTSFMQGNPSLYAVSTSGGRPQVISARQGLNVGAAASPDGSRIALTMTVDGNSEIYTMAPDGSRPRRLTDHWAIDSSPTWSPDGRRIAFVSARFGDPQIFVMNADGTEPRRLTDRGTYNTTPDWSPRGDVIAFTARDERNVFDIFTVDVATREIRRLTQDQGNNEEPSFSPDGNLIAFTSTREGRSQLWLMGLDGSQQRRLTKAGGFITPAWSPYFE